MNRDYTYDNEHNLNIHNIRPLRGISLFEEIPLNRSCYDGLIPFAQCSCGKSDNIKDVKIFQNITGITFETIKSILLHEVVKKTDEKRNICVIYDFEKITNIKKQEFNGDTLYSFDFYLKPGNSKFTIPLSFTKTINGLDYKIIGKVVRTSRYNDQSHCIHDSVLKNFCYCKDLLTKISKKT